MKNKFSKKTPKRLLGYLFAFAIMIFSNPAVAQCTHTLNMYDSYGDGWNGSTVDVTVNGVTVVTAATIASGSTATATFNAATGDTVNLSNWSAGSYTSEVAWDITDGDGTVITSGGTSSGGGGYGLLASGAGNAYCTPTPCLFTLNMFDSYGDGWNGCAVSVTVNGAVVVTAATIASGSTGTATFSASSADTVNLSSWVLGSYSGEVAWDITDGSGVIIASGGTSTGGGGYGLTAGVNGATGSCPAGFGGCMDPFASNYNAAAGFDDGSCTYPGCQDALASNYCGSCNVNDSLSCTYYACGTLDYTQNFESANFSTVGFTTTSADQSIAGFTTSANAITDTVSLEFSGGLYNTYGSTPSTESAAFAKTDYLSSSSFCMDFTGSQSIVNMSLSADLISGYTSKYTWYRLKVNGVVIADDQGNTAYNNSTLIAASTLSYDLSAYANTANVYFTIEASCKYGTQFSYASIVRIDDINIFNVYPCTFYAASITGTDVTCNAGADGSATCTVSSPVATSNTYLWSDALGQTTATATGLVAGTYTCITTDALNGCVDTASITLTEPAAWVVSAVVTNVPSATSTIGAVNLTVGGATPLYAAAGGAVSNANTSTSYYYEAQVFDVIATNDLGITSLDIKTGAGINGTVEVFYRNGTANGNELSSATWINAYSSTALNVNTAGTVSNLPVNITVNAGDTVGIYIYCSLSMSYNYGSGLMAYSNIHASDANLSLTTGRTSGNATGSFTGSFYGTPTSTYSYNFNGTVNYGLPSYLFAWSTLATTEDVSGLSTGSVSCTITDASGCTYLWADSIIVSITNGCTDPIASNYNGTANVDDGSCLYPGCMDTLALNYDSTSNISDTSCVYDCYYYGDNVVYITMYNQYSSGDWIYGSGEAYLVVTNGITSDTLRKQVSGLSITDSLCLPDGCWDVTFYDGGAGYLNQYYWEVKDTAGVVLTSGGVPSTGPSGSGSYPYGWTGSPGFTDWQVFSAESGTNCILGCMDMTALNYDVTATISDTTACLFCTDNFYNLTMIDSYGDGWNGNSFVINQIGGVAGDTATLASGSLGDAYFCLPDGCYDISWINGSYMGEVSWLLTDILGDTILTGGAPYTGNLNINSTCQLGCMDTLGANYDSTAIFADSCAYLGCLDILAQNYSSMYNVMDSTACIYAGCGTSLPYSEDFSGGYIGTDFTLSTGGNAGSSIDGLNNSDTTWHGQGGTYLGWASVTNGPDAFSMNPTHIATASLCLDLTAYSGQPVMMTFDLRQEFSFNSSYGYFRVTDGTNVLSSNLGNDYYQAATACADAWVNQIYDLSAYAGSTVTIEFQSAGKYEDDYYQCGDNAYVDDINITVAVTPITGCIDATASNYNSAANVSDSSCVYCGPGYAYVNINCDYGSYQYEVSWNLVNDLGVTVLSGGAPYNLDTCLASACYTINMFDSYGDGWNGNVFSITESMSGSSSTSTLASGSSGSNPITLSALGCYVYGCTNPLAVNYNANANTDNNTCILPGCGTTLPYTEDFELGYALDMTLAPSTAYQSSSTDSSNNQSVYSWQGQGGNYAGYNYPYNTGPLAFANSPSHIASGALCIDLTNVTSTSVAMTFDLRQEYTYNTTYSWFRVKVDSTVLTSTAGMDYFKPTDHTDPWMNHIFDLSAYIGQSISIEFQSCARYGDNYYTTGGVQHGDQSFVDNINIFNSIWGCTDTLASNYNALANANDGSCVYPCHVANTYANGFEDGLASLNLTPADWTQNTDDNTTGNSNYGDWIWDAFGTTSSLTGPNYSVNYGGSNYAMEGSYYMYIEASGNYNNDVSMTSHCFDISTLPNAELKFWYNMYGTGMGSLGVELSSDGGVTWDSTWTVSGNQGVEWVEAEIDVSTYAATGVTVKLTGTTGADYYSDICVDAMSFVDASIVLGCTDSLALNYDTLANSNDGSCTYPCLNNTEVIEMFSSNGSGWNGGTYTITNGIDTVTGGLSGGYFTNDTLCLVTGCYDVIVTAGSNAAAVSTFNFGSLTAATTGSYVVSVGGANCAIPGCMDTIATNYDPVATVSDSSCTYDCAYYGLNEVEVVMYNSLSGYSWAQGVGEAFLIVTNGTSSDTLNKSVTGSSLSHTLCLTDDCWEITFYDGNASYLNEYSWEVKLGTTVLASGGSYSTGTSYADMHQFSTGGVICGLGCMDPIAMNYDPAATVNDSTLCVYCVYGCMDSTMYNYNATATCDTATATSCIPFIYGCTDIIAYNYDVLANTDDGTCVYQGCMDSLATNYCAVCTIPDLASCVYPCSNYSLNVFATNVTCYDGNDGAVIVSPAGGSGSYNPIIWSHDNTLTSLSVSGLSEGTYTCIVGDLNYGCLDSITVIITQPTAPVVTVVSTDVLCNGSADGSALINVVGGASGSAWGSAVFATNLAWNTLPAGTIFYSVTDTVNGCVINDSVVIAQPSALTLATSVANVSCNGACDGVATPVISGGVPAYQYASVSNLAALCAGTHSYSVTDANGCVISDTIIVTEPDVLTVAENTTDVTCNGGADGTAVVDVVSGGTPAYVTDWYGATTSALVAGSYDYAVEDSNGCLVSGTVVINEPTAVTGLITQVGNSLVVSGSGGVAPYTYAWTTGDVNDTISPSVTGTYYCVVTDANGCVSDSLDYEYVPTAITNIAIEAISVYPNPSNGVFVVSFESNTKQMLDVEVVSILGKVVFSENLDNFIGTYKKEVNLATYAKGVYFLEISTDQGKINKKLILQ